MKRWYVVYTKAAQERLAQINLSTQGFETYLPLYPAQRKYRAGPRPTGVPMFSRYLFVHLDLDAGPWRAVASTIGVSRLIAFGDRPAFVADAVVAEIRGREDAAGLVTPPAPEPLVAGDAVAIHRDDFEAVRGLFDARTGTGRASVLISLLGREVAVSVSPEQLRRAS